MSTGAWLIVCGGATLLGMWIGGAVAAVALRDQLRNRGRWALHVLEGMRQVGDPYLVPVVPAARLLAKLSQLPDPYPFTREDPLP